MGREKWSYAGAAAGKGDSGEARGVSAMCCVCVCMASGAIRCVLCASDDK